MTRHDNDKPSQSDNKDSCNADHNENEDLIGDEYDMLDSKLDDLNQALDVIEQKNDDIREKLMELLQSNRDVRQQLRLANSEPNKKQES